MKYRYFKSRKSNSLYRFLYEFLGMKSRPASGVDLLYCEWNKSGNERSITMRAHIPFHLPIPHTSRARHLLEALLIGILIALTALGLSYWVTRRAVPMAVVTTPAVDPALPSVLNYIQVHASIPAHAVVDPAVPGVLSYIQVHNSIPAHASAIPIDPAMQSVLDYIRVHASIRPAAPVVDPATQSVLDYLRVHGN